MKNLSLSDNRYNLKNKYKKSPVKQGFEIYNEINMR